MQLIGASATVNDELKEDLVDLGWGDHVAVIKSTTLEGKHSRIPSCIKHQYILCDESDGRTKVHALARCVPVLNWEIFYYWSNLL